MREKADKKLELDLESYPFQMSIRKKRGEPRFNFHYSKFSSDKNFIDQFPLLSVKISSFHSNSY